MVSLTLVLTALFVVQDPPPAVVTHVQVVSDKVPDISSIDAWKRSFIKEGMTDQEKAVAAWTTVVTFQHQDSPPREFLHSEDDVHDPIKLFNVYGYAMCCNASCGIEALSRHAGLRARGWAIRAHSVPEVFYDDAWHLFDASLINYFPKADGKVASVEEIMGAIREWYGKNPGFKGDDAKLRAFHRADQWQGWKKGPELLTLCPNYDKGGWWP